MSGFHPPSEWHGRSVGTLDVLLFVKRRLDDGFPSLQVLTGKADVHLFAAFVQGVQFHLCCGGFSDPAYQAFVSWLRDVVREFPSPGGWQEKYLLEANGDHEAAIRRFLARCHEFAALNEPHAS